MSTLATTLRTKQKSSGARGMIALGLGTLVAIAVTVLIVALPGTTHPRTATVGHHSSGSRALGLSATPGPGPATASHSALTNAPLYRGSSAAGHQPGAAAPVARDAAVSAASAPGAHTTDPTQVPGHTSYGAVP
jgi:hypothetical protein